MDEWRMNEWRMNEWMNEWMNECLTTPQLNNEPSNVFINNDVVRPLLNFKITNTKYEYHIDFEANAGNDWPVLLISDKNRETRSTTSGRSRKLMNYGRDCWRRTNPTNQPTPVSRPPSLGVCGFRGLRGRWFSGR